MCAIKIQQYLPNKPHKWGFKLYVLCSLSGYAYSFEVYSGAKNVESSTRTGFRSGIEYSRSIAKTNTKECQPYPIFRQFLYQYSFITLPNQRRYLLSWYRPEEQTGQDLQVARQKKVLKSTVTRGAYHENVASFEGMDFSATSWKDNKQVLLLSIYVGCEPAESITRYDKKIKRNIQVPCPRVIKEYNAHMGGVDLMDSFIGRYYTRIKSRKWTMRLFYHLLDITIINSWVLYKNVNVKRGTPQKDILKLTNFRTELADTL
ncbi:PiggyBac transposable element-derived protein 4 [Eumeta japonica]|uniref:PiggyBac transposable element-derived protein 4 n=1 Tax=Eumeta variegata TaxID=151549 RepID=A0A4C1UR47_EUMVA|nr:PiggyBac transposable element-derived protein 4 [Eumeta japonica]